MRRALVLAIGVALAAAAPATAAPPPAAHVWVTTLDRALALSERAPVPFTRDAPTALTITVDPSRTYQTVDGFGASLTDSSAAVLYRLDRATRDRTMASLFDPRTGNGISYLRQPMGASDFVADRPYTYDDLPAGETDYAMRRFSIAHDEARILPLLRQARRLNPDLRILASPWSPPAWMKTGGSLVGGRLIDDPRIYRAYALYFVKFIRAYARAGVPVDAVSPQNEPQNRHPKGYPGLDLPVAQQKKFIAVLGPALREAGLDTKILAYDHNWSMHPDDIAATPPGETPELGTRPTCWPIHRSRDGSQASRTTATSATRRRRASCAAGTPARVCTSRNAAACSPTDPSMTFTDTVKWHSRNLVIGATRNWAKTVVNWNLALDPSGGPHVGGCDTCTGVVTVGPGRTCGPMPSTTRSATSPGSSGRGRSGSRARRSARPGGTARSWTSPSAIPTGPPRWWCTTRTTTRARSRWRWADTRSPTPCPAAHWRRSPGRGRRARGRAQAARRDRRGRGGLAAVDDDASTRWSTGTAQASGQYLQVDLGCRTRQPARAGHRRGRATIRGGTPCRQRRRSRRWSRPSPPAPARASSPPSPSATAARLPARRPDRNRPAMVVGRRPADLPLRKSSCRRHVRIPAPDRGGARPPRGTRLDGLVAAWLPGSEGRGVADTLFGTRRRSPAGCR